MSSSSSKGRMSPTLSDISIITASSETMDAIGAALSPGFGSAAVQSKEVPRPISHPRWYIHDENVEIVAGGYMFRVPRYSLQRGSERFRELSAAQKLNPDGTRAPIVLPVSITDEDFERFLDLLYPIVFGTYALHTSKEWTSALRVAHYLRFDSIRALAMKQLYSLASPVEKIVCAREFDIPQWLQGAYTDLCLRSAPLCPKEGRLLGLSTCLKIAAAREALRTPAAPIDQTLATPIVKETFGLGVDGNTTTAIRDQSQSIPPSASATSKPCSPDATNVVRPPLFPQATRQLEKAPVSEKEEWNDDVSKQEVTNSQSQGTAAQVKHHAELESHLSDPPAGLSNKQRKQWVQKAKAAAIAKHREEVGRHVTGGGVADEGGVERRRTPGGSSSFNYRSSPQPLGDIRSSTTGRPGGWMQGWLAEFEARAHLDTSDSDDPE
ncbi:hypothetical protein PUNSTDRAFT_105732 [Punctularia strigosozonata HHB-11173 SS5]|uniref:uncharacterized protein n=1 Tax=Punctularia strigosozonata (strain HHB-11173) TaxID=741275 RepID=UPI000441857B|nr:uncharacterized protein PUNSTDRAFT_105732 [Punctularia strigosozonata HHB-11173 SS5]EIN06621.1 hypothetical protein PUNSTDRAFT_105732 [Punctularia strigosozonata HHB-11173 SS5]